HTTKITGGKTYAELDQEDPNRAVAMDSAFLQASLFTSVVAFGVAAMALALGIVLALIGFALRAPARAVT
ncbi:MAG: aromatic ring-opening dioxygenase LigA, partial [Nocardioides sp.]